MTHNNEYGKYSFRYLEDLALAKGTMANIKLLEGLTIAAETLGGEVIFFSLSGKIAFWYDSIFT